jgi:hypothetical protein
VSADESLAAAREDLPAAQAPVPDASLIADATWNDEPVQARRVVVVVGEARSRGYWSEALVGQQRNAIEVKTRRERFFIDDEKGIGEAKVTSGDWREPYAILPVQRIVCTRPA